MYVKEDNLFPVFNIFYLYNLTFTISRDGNVDSGDKARVLLKNNYLGISTSESFIEGVKVSYFPLPFNKFRQTRTNNCQLGVIQWRSMNSL